MTGGENTEQDSLHAETIGKLEDQIDALEKKVSELEEERDDLNRKFTLAEEALSEMNEAIKDVLRKI